jgi:hypothetical protein
MLNLVNFEYNFFIVKVWIEKLHNRKEIKNSKLGFITALYKLFLFFKILHRLPKVQITKEFKLLLKKIETNRRQNAKRPNEE